MKQKIVSHIVRPTWSVKKVVKISYSSYLFSVAKLRFGKKSARGSSTWEISKVRGEWEKLGKHILRPEKLGKTQKTWQPKKLGKTRRKQRFLQHCIDILLQFQQIYVFNQITAISSLSLFSLPGIGTLTM